MNLNAFLLKKDLASHLIDEDLLDQSADLNERDAITQYLKQPPTGAAPSQLSLQVNTPQSTTASLTGNSYGIAPVQEFLPTVISLTGRMLQELDTNTGKLLTLNRSRKEKIASHLWRLAGSRPAGSESENPLRYWIETTRSHSQDEALKTYLEEVALIYIGQCVLLRLWSAYGHRKWCEKDLSDLNWTLTQALKPYHPIDRDGWQLIRPNIYSWYSPSSAIQKEIFNALDLWEMVSDVSDFIPTLLRSAQQSSLRRKDQLGMDHRFYIALWKKITDLGFDPEPEETHLRRRKTVYTPTLRDGQMMRFAPSQMTWVGMESYPFLLMQAELSQLSKGPAAPQLWALGFGIENHSRDQLSFGLTTHRGMLGRDPSRSNTSALGAPLNSATLAKITDLESCDFSIVLEESCIRLGSRSQEAHLLREQLESLDYFKRVKTSSTSLGLLQACVALTKLRPGSLLLWARSEPLRASDGKDGLRFLLERSQLVGEWNYSELHHQLPSETPLYPQYLYLFRREPNLQARLEHKPLRFVVQGQIRSHIEVPMVLDDSFSLREITRSGWSIKLFGNQSSQREWMEDWPEAACPMKLRQFESIWKNSVPLGAWALVRPTPEPETANLGSSSELNSAGTIGLQTGGSFQKPHWEIQQPLQASGYRSANVSSYSPGTVGTWTLYGQSNGFWVKTSSGSGVQQKNRKLVAKPLPFGEAGRVSGSGYLVLVPQPHWAPTLSHFLESAVVTDYLDHHVEKKGDRWILKEANIKMIPVAKEILLHLGAAIESFGEQSPLKEIGKESKKELGRKGVTPSTEALALDFTCRTKAEPLKVLENLKSMGPQHLADDQKRHLLARVYIASTNALVSAREQLRLLSRMVKEDKSTGAVSPVWREILSVLARSECLPASYHELIHIQGSLPSHVPIIEIRKVQHPAPGILFATESGFHLTMASSDPLLLEMLFDQLQGVQSPTWSELSQFIKLPKKTELARITANEFLNDFQGLKKLEHNLLQLADACLECLHLNTSAGGPEA